MSASAHVDLPDFTAAEARLYGAGSMTGVQIDSVFLELLDGHAVAEGTVTWWPEVNWDVLVEGDELQLASLLPDSEEWPGQLSMRGSATGGIRDGELELQAAIDTVYGMIRDEPLGGRLEVHILGEEIELPTARLSWGPARVTASGTASEVLELEFDADVPDLGLLLPGAAGSLTASGGASGPRDTPRLRATVRANSIVVEGVSATSVTGDVDLDLAGPLQADLVAQSLVVAEQELDSAHVVLTGNRERHELELTAAGPGLEFDLAAAGGLDASNTWSGVMDTLYVSADTLGRWELTAPVALTLGPGVAAAPGAAAGSSSEFGARFEQICLESAPAARVCAEGEFGGSMTRFSATVDSLRVERFAALMPEGYRAEAGVDAVIDIEQEPGGAFTGTIDVRTTEGSVTLPIGRDRDTGEKSTTLFFEPIVLAVSSTDEGSSGQVDLLVTDSARNQLLRVDGELNSPFALHESTEFATIGDQPFSARLELAVDDLELFSASVLPRWDAWGSFHASAQLDVDADRRLVGTLSASTDSVRLRNTVREQSWRLAVDPARLDARVGPDGLTGELELELSVVDEGPLLQASGEIRMPQLTSLDVNPEDQPVDASLSVRVGDLYFIEAFLPEVTEASGSFELDSQIGGTLAELTVDGQANLADGRALIPLLGLELTDIQFAATGKPAGGIDLEGQVRSGDGILTLSGRSERYPTSETPTRMTIRGERFQVIDAPEISLVAEPSLDLAFDGSKLSVTGTVQIPRGRIGIPEVPESAVTPSRDVVIVGDTLAERDSPIPIEADITVTLGDDVLFNGFGFSSALRGELNITQAAGRDPQGRGEVRFVNGTFRQLGQELRIDPGRLRFNGPIDDPTVEAQAFVRTTDGTEAGFRIRGTVQNLDVTTYSVPPKSDSDIMAYILFGRPMSETTGEQGNQATNAATILGANMLAMSLAPRVGLDEARVETGAKESKAQFVVGKYLSPKLYVGYGIGIYEPISTLRLRYLLTA
ncbi:MAG TPA: translocation/assembly module TamB domain-containing protein, partial [Polyangia bacterium]|nr:translocation/assembly module TamB domain-containing protein [Polyangia bacterium]